jgi:type IV secretion system protein VirB1
MMPADFIVLAQQCAPQVAPATLAAIVRTESGFNPYAIGVVHGRLVRQPQALGEAFATARELDRQGWNYSVGLAQVNRTNFTKRGLTLATAFDPCRNLAAGAAILQQCFEAARDTRSANQQALRASLSCYASGDFVTGYRTGYVQRVVDNASAQLIPSVPAIVPEITPIPVVPVTAVPIVRGRSAAIEPTRVSDGVHESGDGVRGTPDDGSARAAPEASAVVF